MYELSFPIKDGKVAFELDSFSEGILNLSLVYPWSNDTLIYRDKKDNTLKKVIKKNRGKSIVLFAKKIYINSEQSSDYHIKFTGEVTPEVITAWNPVNYYKSWKYPFKVYSTSEDGNLYEKFDSLYNDFNGSKMFKILDSMYEKSTITDKIYNDFVLDAITHNADLNYQKLLDDYKKLIAANLTNPVSPFAMLDINDAYIDKNREEFNTLLDKMDGRAKQSSYYKQARIKFGLKKTFEIGSLFEPPIGKTPKGQDFLISPKNYKYTLVEFWAPWCIPCRKQNPGWNNILKTYGKNGFQILGVSFSKDLGKWIEAIKNDKIQNWLHVSDLESDAFTGTNALTYGIESIPFNFLIDDTGKIILRDVSPEVVEKFLEKQIPLKQIME